MLALFFHNMTLVIACTFIFSKMKLYVYKNKTNHKLLFKIIVPISNSLLAILTMFQAFHYEGIVFDLRSVPVFFASYVLGWKGGCITSLLPILYRLYIGGHFAWKGIIVGILLPIVVGAFFHKFQEVDFPIQIVHIKKIMIGFLIFSLSKAMVMKMIAPLSYSVWFDIYINMTIFSMIALLSMVLMINETNKSIIAKGKLERSEKRYRKLVELLPDAIFVYREGKVILTNTAGVKLTGQKSIEEVIEKQDKPLIQIHKDYKKNYRERLKKLRNDEVCLPFYEAKILRYDEQEIDVEIGSSSFSYEGEHLIIVAIRDISKRKEAEALQKKSQEEKRLLQEEMEYDKLKIEFFANLSHEMKTPVHLIYSTTQLLEFTLNNQFASEKTSFHPKIKILRQNCNRLLRLIDNLIDVIKVDAGYFQLYLQNCDIVNVVENITLSITEYTKNKGISLLFDTDVEEKVMAIDPHSMERIILNLLSNGVKFTKPGGAIWVNVQDKGDHVSISVKDTGEGIPEDKIGIIFERFRQVDKSFRRNHEGSGIGLALVKSLVNMHGGEIRVKSEYGKGSEFIIHLPVKILDQEEIINYDMEDTYIETVNIQFSDIYG